jgi:hypothetical protein
MTTKKILWKNLLLMEIHLTWVNIHVNMSNDCIFLFNTLQNIKRLIFKV